jgi:hypothetical protein
MYWETKKTFYLLLTRSSRDQKAIEWPFQVLKVVTFLKRRNKSVDRNFIHSENILEKLSWWHFQKNESWEFVTIRNDKIPFSPIRNSTRWKFNCTGEKWICWKSMSVGVQSPELHKLFSMVKNVSRHFFKSFNLTSLGNIIGRI